MTATRGRRYPASLMAEARRMASADGGGWSAAGVTRILNARGIDVSYQTVLRWVNRRHDDRQRRLQRSYRASRRAGRLGSATATDETKRQRVIALRALGFGWSEIVRLIELDFGESIPPLVLAQAIRRGRRWPRPTAASEGQAA